MKDNFVDETTRLMARKAIDGGQLLGYMAFWDKAPEGQREKAKAILRNELAR